MDFGKKRLNLIVLLISILLLLPIISSDDSKQPILISRTASTETYRNPDGTLTTTLYSGEMFMDTNKGMNQPNYIPITSELFSIINSTKTGFIYESNDTYSDYKIYFKNNSNTDSAVRFEKDGYFFTYDLSGGQLLWAVQDGKPAITDTLGSGAPSNSQNSIVNISKINKFEYPTAFFNTTVTYELYKDMLKETFILKGLPSIKDYFYLQYTGNIKFNKTLDICANDRCYTPSGTQDDFETSGRIEFKNKGETIFYLKEPIIWDSNRSSTVGIYAVKGSDAQMKFALRINSTWIKNAVYPIYIDPTITLRTADTENLKDASITDFDPDGNYGSSTVLNAGLNIFSRLYRSYITFNISSLNGKLLSVQDANLSLRYERIVTGAPLNYTHVYNDWAGLAENQLTWNNQPCGINMDNSTNCNITGKSIIPTSVLRTNFSVGDYVEYDSTHNRNNVSFAVFTIEGISVFYSKEYTEVSDRPSLSIIYTSLNITIISPNKTYYNNSNFILNISTVGAMDVCYWTNNSGETNYTMLSASSTSFFNDTASTLLKDSSNTLKFYCNFSSDGSWVSSLDKTLVIDTTYPLISYGDGTQGDYANLSQSSIYVNTSWTELNFNNITFNLYNTSSTVNSTIFTSATYLINWTNLPDTNYTYQVNITDLANNQNATSLRHITLDTTPPQSAISSPSQFNSYNTNNSMNLNFTVSDVTSAISSCWYNVMNWSGNYSVVNTTITDCANTTFMLPGGDIDYNLTFYVNDSANNVNTTVVTFGIRTLSPVINLLYPSDNQFFNSEKNIFFNFTGLKDVGLSVCKLYGNWTGTWHNNYTWLNPANNTMNWTVINLSETQSIWNVWCNDTLNNVGWGFDNYTFTIDLTYPEINITKIGTTVNSQTIYFNHTVTDTYLDSCKYSIFKSTGGIDGLNENISISCGANDTSATVSAFGTYNLTVYAKDKAGNENYSTKIFTTSILSGGTPSGGGAFTMDTVYPAVALQSINTSRKFSDLELAVFFTAFNSACEKNLKGSTLSVINYYKDCSLDLEELNTIKSSLNNISFILNNDEIMMFYQQYKNNKIFNVYLTQALIDDYNLLQAFLQNLLTLNPSRVDTYFIARSVIKYPILANQELASCEIISETPGMSCWIEKNTTAVISYNLSSLDFLSQIVSGKISITSKGASSKEIQTQYEDVLMRVFNPSYRVLGFLPFYLLVVIISVLMIIGVYYFFKVKKIRNFKAIQKYISKDLIIS